MGECARVPKIFEEEIVGKPLESHRYFLTTLHIPIINLTPRISSTPAHTNSSFSTMSVQQSIPTPNPHHLQPRHSPPPRSPHYRLHPSPRPTKTTSCLNSNAFPPQHWTAPSKPWHTFEIPPSVTTLRGRVGKV